MLSIFGNGVRLCDGLSRRGFLKIGALSFSGMSVSLADVLRAEASEPHSRPKSVINIFLGGGPAHQDTFDLKPDAPSEVRGEFDPIATRVPGRSLRNAAL